MSNIPLYLMAALNALAFVNYLRAGDYGLSLTFACYGVACLGVAWSNNLRNL
jgi:hypothetical protein